MPSVLPLKAPVRARLPLLAPEQKRVLPAVIEDYIFTEAALVTGGNVNLK